MPRFVNCNISPAVLAPIGRSDHAVVSWNPRVKNFRVFKKRVRNFSSSNKVRFQRALSFIDWSVIESFDDPDYAMSLFHDVLLSIFDFCFPHVKQR